MLHSNLEKVRSELLDDKRSQITEKIKTTIVELIQEKPVFLRLINPSLQIAKKCRKEYRYLMTLFPEVKGNKIEY